MPKMKTHSGAKKRFRVTGTGKVMREQAGGRHLLERQDRARRRASSRTTSSCPRPTPRRSRSFSASDADPPDQISPDSKEYSRGTREAGGQRPEEAPGRPRAGQRLPRAALASVPQGQGAGPALPRLRLPRPSRPQGRLPSPVDPADQRRGPRERHDLQPVHPGPQGRRDRGRPSHARRPRRQRRRRLHRAGRDLPGQRPSPPASRAATPPDHRPHRRPRAGAARADQPPVRPGAVGRGAGPALGA